MSIRSGRSHGRRTIRRGQRPDPGAISSPPGDRPRPGSNARGAGFDRRTLAARAWQAGLAMMRRDSTVRRALALADVLALATALALAILAAGSAPRPAVLLVFPFLVVLAKLSGLYDRDAHVLRRSTLDEAPELFQLSTLTALVVWLAGGAIAEPGFEAAQALILWVSLFVLAVGLRTAARYVSRRVSPIERCLFVGDAASASEFAEKLATSRGVKAELVGWIRIDDHFPAPPSGSWAARLVPRIDQLAVERAAQRVVLAPGPGASEELVNSVREIKDAGLKVSVLPRHARVAGQAVALDQLDGITLLGVKRFHIPRSSRAIKRSFDIAGSALGLIAVSPLLGAIAVAVRLDSAGPVLFGQVRAGRDGRPFRMHKFRTMAVGAEDQRDALLHRSEARGLFKLREDPRVTRVGRILRRYSLDELPQLWNVLRGEMSLVGPRPLPLEEDQRIEGWRRRRLELRPGITGPWQILGSTDVTLREMANIDNQYVADWSLWNDIRILLLTLPHVAGRRGI